MIKTLAFAVGIWLCVFWPAYLLYLAIKAWKQYHVNRRQQRHT